MTALVFKLICSLAILSMLCALFCSRLFRVCCRGEAQAAAMDVEG